LSERALPNAPNGYAPVEAPCPSDRPEIRSASSLSPSEVAWLNIRRPKAADALRDLLQRLEITDFDTTAYFDQYSKSDTALPIIGIAASGGGYRALMSSGGAISAFDSRETQVHLGGLLQSATYFSGLSGGSWLVGSIYLNNFTTVASLVSDVGGSSVWAFEQSILVGPKTVSNYYASLLDAVDTKVNAGFEASITDYW
jgi:lysophospholipase